MAYVVITLPLFVIMTRARNELWRDPVRLWADSVSKSPLKSRPQVNFGYELHRRGDLDLALEAYQRAHQLSFNDHGGTGTGPGTGSGRMLALTNMSDILVRQNKIHEALAVLRLLWNEYPGFPAAAVNLSKILGELGRLEDALAIVNAGIHVGPIAYPWYPSTELLYLNRAEVLRVMGRWKEAEPDYWRAHQAWPWIPVPECPF